MAYAVSSALAIYFVLWWVVLFVTLPFGVRSQHEEGTVISGSDPGAPVLARMKAKLVLTTLLSALLFTLALGAYRMGWLSVERITRWMGTPF